MRSALGRKLRLNIGGTLGPRRSELQIVGPRSPACKAEPGLSGLDGVRRLQIRGIGQHAHFGESAIVEHVGDRIARFDHDQPNGAGLQVAAIGAGPKGGDGSAGNRRERPVESAHDRADPDVRRRPGERIAAAFPLLGIDEPGQSFNGAPLRKRPVPQNQPKSAVKGNYPPVIMSTRA